MPLYRRFQRQMNPVKKDKHEVVFTALAEAGATIREITLTNVVPIGDKNLSQEVGVGSHVYGIYCEFQVNAEQTGTTNILHWQFMIDKTGQSLTGPSSYYQKDRSQVIKRGMEMIPKSIGTITKRIIFVSIPKIYQRMKDGDTIKFRYITTAADQINICGFFIYKEIY